MKIEMIFEKIVSFFINLPTLWFYGYCWRLTHKEMVERFCKKSKKSTYSEVARLIKSNNWEFDRCFPTSLIDYNTTNQFHANIIEFNGVGHILTTYGLIRATMLKKKILKKLTP